MIIGTRNFSHRILNYRPTKIAEFVTSTLRLDLPRNKLQTLHAEVWINYSDSLVASFAGGENDVSGEAIFRSSIKRR